MWGRGGTITDISGAASRDSTPGQEHSQGMQNIDELRESGGFFAGIYWLETKGFPEAKLSFISGIVDAWLMPSFSIIGLCGKSVLLWKWISNIFRFSCYNTFLRPSCNDDNVKYRPSDSLSYLQWNYLENFNPTNSFTLVKSRLGHGSVLHQSSPTSSWFCVNKSTNNPSQNIGHQHNWPHISTNMRIDTI